MPSGRKIIGAVERVFETAGLLITIVGLVACGPLHINPTGYARANPQWGSRYGYIDKRIDDDTFSVVTRGNPITNKERIAEIALLRAAYITTEQGKTHFVIQKQRTEVMGAEELVSLPLGGLFIWVPVGSRETTEPTAILLIRVLPIQSQHPPEAIEAADVIKRFSKKFE